MPDGNVIYDRSLITDYDVYLFKEGGHFRLHEKLGSHIMEGGVLFALWAPNAETVSVMGGFNGWSKDSHHLKPRWDGSGIWEGFVPGIGKGEPYKYHIVSKNGHRVDKGDPFALYWETPPSTASIVWDNNYEWSDSGWMQGRGANNAHDAPVSIYEMHIGSWMRVPEEGNRPLTYRELAPKLAEYLKEAGFTHVQFMPVMEHPFYGSWGYQCVGYFAPTSRYGTPQDFMNLIDTLHQNGIGVILDWVPSHFPGDAHGLAYFDGTHLYEHMYPQKGFHPEWKSYIFNYGRYEVKNFLLSSALFWLERFHADGLRVDAVASMLYLDYARRGGDWMPNQYGGNENIEAIYFLRRLNEVVYERHPDVQTIAEESTAWPMVSRPSYVGGLGFGMKWNMGWMHDTLEYFSKEPVYRKFHQDKLTFSILYAFTENFVLPLSHDEVVYGKRSLKDKMPGDAWQQFANLRLLYGYMFCQPGKKLLFMGGEFGQWQEWDHESSLHWHLAEYPLHRGVRKWVSDLNALLRAEPALHRLDFDHNGFEWVDFSDGDSSVISFIRKSGTPGDEILAVCNFTPVLRENYRIGVPYAGYWREVLNSDAVEYEGSGQGNSGGVQSSPFPCHGRYDSISITLPPLGIVVFKRQS